jgi:subtilisin-like proprotein convertase family protein
VKRDRTRQRREQGRKAARRRATLQAQELEPRQMLSLVPSVVQRGVIDPSTQFNETSPSIAVNPQNDNQLVAVWTRAGDNNTFTGEAAFSADGGATWLAFDIGAVLTFTAANSNEANPFPQVTDAQVAFDRSNNFYILTSQHTADNGQGALVLNRFSTGVGFPVKTLDNNILYSWAGGANANQAVKPVLGVDSSVTSYQDPTTGAIQNNPASGNVYVAWATIDAAPPNTQNWNPNAIRVIASSNQGVSFTPPATVNDGGNIDLGSPVRRHTAPKIAISQGTADGRVQAGRVSLIWEDFNSGNNVTPLPVSRIWLDQFAGTSVRTASRSTAGQAIADAGANNAATTTSIPLNVAGVGFTSLSSLSVRVAIVHPSVNDLSLSLVYDPLGANIVVPLAATGNVTGANMGVGGTGGLSAGSSFGTTFADGAPLPINNGSPPFIGTFRPTGLLSSFNGVNPNGLWVLRVTDSTTNNAGVLQDFTLNFSGSALGLGTDRQIATSTVRGQAGAGGLITSAAAPGGIGAGAVIASDNTLGSFSQFQGRLYVAYTDRTDSKGNPAENTDVRLIGSDDGGTSWSTIDSRVNDDAAGTDGFSESNRPQFAPQLGVDTATGAVAISFWDVRHDAARSRPARYFGVSIDGGATMLQTFANEEQWAFDLAAQRRVTMGPIPENPSNGAYGDNQGLAILGGKIYNAWAGNQNGGIDGKATLDTQFARATYGTGARIISGTMGPVSLPGNTLNPAAADGSAQFQRIRVGFDRPVLASSFTSADLQIQALAPNLAPLVINPGVISVSPLNTVTSTSGINIGSTQFEISFQNPLTQVGTYSYAIGPDIRTRYRLPGVDFQQMDQDGDNNRGEAQNDRFSAPETTNGTPFGGSFVADSLPIIVPGPRVRFTSVPGVSGNSSSTDNLATDRTVSALDLTFTHAMQVGTFTTEDVLRLQGPVGPVAGPFTVTPVFNSGFLAATVANGASQDFTITAPNDGGLFTIANLGVRLGITQGTGSVASDLKVELIPPAALGLGAVTLFDGVGGSGRGFRDTLLVDGGTKAINDPTVFAPFSGAFRPAQPLAGLVGSALQGSWTLRVTDKGTDGKNAVLDAWSLEATPQNTTGVSATTFRIGFPSQQLSGTYHVLVGSDIVSTGGLALDTNFNAGVELLKGIATPNPTAQLTLNSGTINLQIPAGGSVDTKLNLGSSFDIRDLNVALNIVHPDDPDLTAELIAPNGTVIRLFQGVGSTGSRANFTNTVIDDQAATPIEEGGAPFSGRYRPQALPAIVAPDTRATTLGVLNGQTLPGQYTLRITNGGTDVGTLTDWSLVFTRPIAGDTGLGQPVADRVAADFRIFTMDPANSLASSTWTAVGPAAQNNGSHSARIGGLAVDPSDPSGNTVYAAGATGGVWKTNNFLTTDSNGPSWIPLTDLGPTNAINVGGIAVFGRNNDPNQSVVIVATGDGDGGTPGVGFLRSMDGGATWTLLDSTNNTLPFRAPAGQPQRDHRFVGNTAFKVVVDPRPTITGKVIIYAAMSGSNGGLWRSLDTGDTWQLMRAGQATDVEVDPNSGTIDAINNPTGNLQKVYAAFRGEGVYFSPNQGQLITQMVGGVGKPLAQDPAPPAPDDPVPVNAPAGTPNGPFGRIHIAKPAVVTELDEPNAQIRAIKNLHYSEWLYAVVITPDSKFQGLYQTKDDGKNWVKLRVAAAPIPGLDNSLPGVATNDTDEVDVDVFANPALGFAQGNYDVTLTVDPLNPNVVYVGGMGTNNSPVAGIIRVDATEVNDAHAFFLDNRLPTGGERIDVTGGVSLKTDDRDDAPAGTNPRTNPFINMVRNPGNPFGNATFKISQTANFANTGAGVKWTGFDFGQADKHRMLAFRDPLTGRTRLILGDDQGIWTTVDDDGRQNASLGSMPSVAGARSGNIQITQLYYGATQPSSLAAQIAGALFYGAAQDDGFPVSNSGVVSPGQAGYGNIGWNGGLGDGTGVATNQSPTNASGNFDASQVTLYRYNWPCCGGGGTNFFQVNGVGRTTGLLQTAQPGQTPDPQWPYLGGANFAVNPINGDQIVISAPGNFNGTGRVFRTLDKGLNWFPIGEPSALDGTYAPAMAFGAPAPDAPPGNLGDHILAGTSGGNIFVTYTGGNGNQWRNISAGLDGSGVQSIMPSPTRGSYEAYAVTSGGVFHAIDTRRIGDPTAPTIERSWRRITGNLFSLQIAPFGDSAMADRQLRSITSLAVDWRYVIPDDFTNPPANPTDERATHPVLYVGGNGGVFRTLDDGQNWTRFPDVTGNDPYYNLPNAISTTPTPPGAGGNLANARITDMDLTLGNIDRTTGRPRPVVGDPILLTAFTFGRGAFTIRLAPEVATNTQQQPDALTLTPSGLITSPNTIRITNNVRPTIRGTSQQTAFGNTISVNILDLSPLTPGGPLRDPASAPVIGTGATDSAGRFAVQLNAGYFNPNGSTDGAKVLGVQATDPAGTKGNVALLYFTLDTSTPPPPSTPDLTASTDSPSTTDPSYRANITDTDNITNFNNTGGRPPVFRIGNIVQSATVRLFRTPSNAAGVPTGPTIEVATLANAQPDAQGFITLADTNAGVVRIADGYYLYTAQQVDAAGNASLESSAPAGGLLVQIDTTPPTGAVLRLTPADDTGRPRTPDSRQRDRDLITNIETPRFEGTVSPFSFVQLFVNGAAAGGALANDQGFYQIRTTVMLAEGSNAVTITETDAVGNVTTSAVAIAVALDTQQPVPINPTLDPGSDTGPPSNADGITRDNTPTFIGADAEPGALVQVLAQLVTPSGAPQAPIDVVGEALASGGGSYSVTVGQYFTDYPGVQITHLLDGQYKITFVQYDVAGNISTQITFGVPGTVIIDGTDANDHGFFDTKANVNSDGWLYLEKAFDNIGPNVANGNRLVVALGTDATPGKGSGGGFFGGGNAGQAVRSGFEESSLPGLGWSRDFNNDGTADPAIVHLRGATVIDNYLRGLPVNGQVVIGNSVINVTNIRLDDTGILYLPTTGGQTTGDMTLNELAAVNLHGLDIANFVNSGGGLFSHAEESFNPAIEAYGWLKAIFPGIIVVQETGGAFFGGGGSTIQITPEGMAAFPGLTPADLSTGPWHNWFGGDLGALTVLATDLTDLGVRVPLILTGKSTAIQQLVITIDTVQPVAPGTPDLQALSDTPLPTEPGYEAGESDTDDLTYDTSPTFNIPGVEPGAYVELWRTPIDASNNPTGPAVLVATLPSAAPDPVTGLVAITDPSVAGGRYRYTVRQHDQAGNFSGFSTGLQPVIIDLTPPATAGVPDLQPGSDSPGASQPNFIAGVTDADNLTNDTTPTFNIGGLEPRSTLQLLRNGVVVATLVDVTPDPITGLVAITDPGIPTDSKGNPIDGQYTYQSRTFDRAGNQNAADSASLIVTIDTTAPLAPPAPDLTTASDTGSSSTDNITRDNRPFFEVVTAEATATIELLRRVAGSGGAFAVVNRRIGPGLIQDPGPVPSGDYEYAVRQIDLAGNVGQRSSLLTVRIDTDVPAAPNQPDLQPGSDTPRNNDRPDNLGYRPGITDRDDTTRITLFNFPRFDVANAEADSIVELLRRPLGSAGAFTVVASRVGPGVLADPQPVSDGKFEYASRQTDPAGNVGPLSAALVVTYDTTAPLPPVAPDLQATSDSGDSSTDNVTSATSPVFDIGGVEPGATVALLRNGAIVTFIYDAAPDANGVISLADSGVPAGFHTYTAFQMDRAGNASPLGGALQIRVITVGPNNTSVPDLIDSSDTGPSLTDNITRDTTPTFNIIEATTGAIVELLRKPNGSPDSAYQVVATRIGPGQLTDLGIPTDGLGNPVDGKYDYAAQQKDLAGNTGPRSAALTVTIDTRVVAPSQPDLQAASDTGASKIDNITNATILNFDLTGNEAGSNVVLFRKREGEADTKYQQVGTRTGDGTVTDLGPLAAGRYVYVAQQTDLAGNLSGLGTTLLVEVVTARPAAPLTPDLLAASDTPLSGEPGFVAGVTDADNNTRLTNLVFQLDGVAVGNTVRLLRDGVQVGEVVAASTSVLLTDANAQAGASTYSAVQIDVAGNTSIPSTGLIVTVDVTRPLTPSAPNLSDASDTGASSTDDITSDTSPTFDITGVEATAFVQLLRNGVPVSGATRTGPGPITDPGLLGNGVYSYAVRQFDRAGNASDPSSVLQVTIDTTRPAALAVAPDLTDASDTGASKTDNVTNAASLEFVVVGGVDGNRVELVRRPLGSPESAYQVVASRLAPSAANLIDTTAPEGVFVYAVRQVVSAGGTSDPSPTLTVTIDRTAPTITSLILAAQDDTGTPGDGKTSMRQPRFSGLASEGPITVNLIDAKDAVLGTATSTSAGGFTVQPGAALLNGTLSLRAVGTDRAGNVGDPSAVAQVTLVTADSDYDGDGKGDIAVYGPTTQEFRIRYSSGGTGTIVFGQRNDIPVPADFNGDGKLELATYRATSSQGFWDIQGRTSLRSFGLRGDIPLPADYSGDGKADLAVFRPSSRRWYINGVTPADGTSWGAAGDIPVPADFDGDGKTDIAVYRPSVGRWYVRGITTGNGVLPFAFQSGDLPAPGDFDGDGRADYAVYRPSTGQFLFLGTTDGQQAVTVRSGNDLPAPTDFDGDGLFDPATYRASNRVWALKRTTLGDQTVQFLRAGDVPLPTPVALRMPAGGPTTPTVAASAVRGTPTTLPPTVASAVQAVTSSRSTSVPVTVPVPDAAQATTFQRRLRTLRGARLRG